MMLAGLVCVRYICPGREGTRGQRPRGKHGFISPVKKSSFGLHYEGLSYKDAIAIKKNLNQSENNEVYSFN